MLQDGNVRQQFEVVLPIKDVLGSECANLVEGVSRIGSFKNPQGVVPIDFAEGQMKAVYELTLGGAASARSFSRERHARLRVFGRPI